MEIELKLAKDEVEAIVKVLGQLPTSSNAYPLLVKIVQQVNAQGQAEEQVAEEAA